MIGFDEKNLDFLGIMLGKLLLGKNWVLCSDRWEATGLQYVRAVQLPLEGNQTALTKCEVKNRALIQKFYSKPLTFAASGARVGSSFLANVSSGT